MIDSHEALEERILTLHEEGLSAHKIRSRLASLNVSLKFIENTIRDAIAICPVFGFANDYIP